jgi:hypothetical protein
MARRGRPPVTRARVLNYIARHKPDTVMQIVRATGADRTHVYRILRAAYGPKFRLRWHESAETGLNHARLAKAA